MRTLTSASIMPKRLAEKIDRREERLVLTRMVLNFVREMHDAYMPQERLSVTLDVMLVGCAVFVGQAEGRPMTATKIAAYLDMPRTTVLRKIEVLKRLNLVEHFDGAYTIPLPVLNERRKLQAGRNLAKIVLSAAERVGKLSETDS